MPTYPERYSLFVFDLDGTLADTREDITESLNHALDIEGLPLLTVEEVTRLVGDGARKLLERALGPHSSPERLADALQVFLDHYRDACTRKTRLYPGVREALEGLGERDLAVLTNKPVLHSRRILAALGIEDRFRQVVGGDSTPARKPDPGGMLSILEALGHAPASAVLIGDSAIDIRTARAAGTAAAFVPYGFRPGAAREVRPDHILSSLLDLLGEIR